MFTMYITYVFFFLVSYTSVGSDKLVKVCGSIDMKHCDYYYYRCISSIRIEYVSKWADVW